MNNVSTAWCQRSNQLRPPEGVRYFLENPSRCDGAFRSRIDQIFVEKIQSSRPRQLVRLSMVSTDVMWVHEGVISARVAVELMRFPVLCKFNIKLAHVI